MIVLSTSPGDSKALEALRSFLIAVLPAGVEVFQAQGNNVPEPQGVDFVIMTPTIRKALATNINVYADCAFVGSVSGSVLTVTSITFGEIVIGAEFFGVNVTEGTTIESFGTGTGGVGTYNLSASQTGVTAPLAAGVKQIIQPAQRTIQLDVHSADLATAGDMAQRICMAFRDETAGDLMGAIDSNVSPLYADDARQAPFVNAEQQYESRWVVDAMLQINESVKLSQQFSDDVTFNLYPVL